MKEVVFDNGKLVLQKRKIPQMEELFLIASKEHDKRKKEYESFFPTHKDFLFVEDNVFETMNTYFSEDIRTEYKGETYNGPFSNSISRRKSNIQFQNARVARQNDLFLRRKSDIKSNNQIVRRVSSLESKQDYATKRQIEELVHNKIGKFVKETFKNELTQTNIESIEQHKYARLSKGSYMTYRGENVADMLKDFKPTENFVVDTELTNANATVFHDVKTGETVIAYRGTDPGSLNLNEIEKSKLPNFSDLKTDGAILLGQEAKTKRFLEAEKTFQKTVNKYGKESLNLTGHSLGSGQALYIGEKFDIPSHNFNGAVSINQVLDDVNNKYLLNKSEQILYRTHLDPVSVGALLTSKNSNRKVVHIDTHLDKANSILETHDIEHFISEGSKVEGYAGARSVVKVVKSTKMAQLSQLTAGNKGNAAFGAISAGVAYEMNKDKSKGEQVYRMGEAVADVSVEPLINSTDVIQSRAIGFTTDEMKSAFDILTGGYFKQDTSKSSNPELNDSVVENSEGLSIGGVKYIQVPRAERIDP